MISKTWEQYHADILLLAKELESYEPDIIVPCMIGGLIPSAIIAKQLGVNDVRPIDIERKGDGRRLVYDIQGDISGKKIVLVEDDMPTGKGPVLVKNIFEQRGAEVKIAAVYVTEFSREATDFYIEIYEGSVEYPWKKYNAGDRLRTRT